MHCLFNHVCSLLLIVVSFISCTGQVKTNLPKERIDQSKKINDNGLGLPKSSDEMKSFLDVGIDPYFIETKDTFSIYGPQCIVRNLIQDRRGNYWLATWHGIIKFDGKVFTNYTLKEGLIHFHVVALFEDSNGNIWFSNARGGVYRYDGKSFVLFTTKDGLADNSANCIAEDKIGHIWFGTEQGASKYDGKTFTNFTIKDGLSDNYINALLKDKTGKMWFGTNNGVNIYDGKSFGVFTDENHLPFKQVVSLFEDRIGNIWIGSGSKQAGGNGLCLYDGKSVKNFVSSYYVMYICEDKNGNLWLAHNKGDENLFFSLYRYDGLSFTKIIEQSKKDNPVIFGIIEDRNGAIWFGTAKGLCRFDPLASRTTGGKSFNYFTK